MKKKKIILTGGIVLVAVVALFYFLGRRDNVEYITIDLEKRDLRQTVSEIGTTKASKEIDLNFFNAGRLSQLNVAVGDFIEKGEILAELDISSLLIREEEALAALRVAKTNQEKLIRGASLQDIAVLEAQVRQTQNSLVSAEQDLEKVKNIVAENIRQAERSLEDLMAPNSEVPMSIKQSVESAKSNLSNIERTSLQSLNNSRSSLKSSLDYNLSVSRSSLDAIKRILDDEGIEPVFSVKNSFYKIETERSYNNSVNLMALVSGYIETAKNSDKESDLKKATDELIKLLDSVFVALDHCFSALEATITSSTFSQTSLDNFKSVINTNKTQVSSAKTNILNSYFSFEGAVLSYETSVISAQESLNQAEANLRDAINSAENTLSLTRVNGEQQLSSSQARVDSAKESYNVSRLQLEKLRAPARSEDLRLAQAQIEQAESSLGLVRRQIEDSKIESPISGRVTKINYDIGEQVLNNRAVLSVLTEGDFEIEVLISESDISKVKIGDKANITFDAFGDDYVFQGNVHFIEPAATSISEVIYYKTKILFNNEDDNFSIRSGMTANVDIITDFRENIFAVPFRAVVSENGDRYVRVLEGRDIKEVPLVLGMRGDQAMVEIISEDLEEGDEIVTSIRNNR
jgi:HlyD family secretion protein